MVTSVSRALKPGSSNSAALCPSAHPTVWPTLVICGFTTAESPRESFLTRIHTRSAFHRAARPVLGLRDRAAGGELNVTHRRHALNQASFNRNT